jgi:hypothetical protein
MTAVHPTAFKQQVAKKKKKEEEFAKQKSTRLRYASGRTNKCTAVAVKTRSLKNDAR